MIHVLALFLISTLAGCASCSSDLKEKTGKRTEKRKSPTQRKYVPNHSLRMTKCLITSRRYI